MKINRQATEDYIKTLIQNAKPETIDNDEKKYWIDLLSVMTEEQLRKLVNIIDGDQKDKIQEFNKLMMMDYEEIGNNKGIS